MNRARFLTTYTGLLLMVWIAHAHAQTATQSTTQSTTTIGAPGALVTTGAIGMPAAIIAPAVSAVTPATTPNNSTAGIFNTVPTPPGSALPADTTGPTAVVRPPTTDVAGRHLHKNRTAINTAPKPDVPAIIPTPDIAAQQNQHFGEDHFTQHPDSLSLALIHRPDLKPEQFIIHFATAYPMTGCAKISGLPHEVEIAKGIATITIEDYSVDMRHLPHAPQYACHLRQHVPAGEIIFNRDDLLARDIRQVDFKLGHTTDSFTLIVDRAHVSLVPRDERGPMGSHFHVRDGGSLTHWFYPPGTVILYAQGTHHEDVKPAVETVARTLGLHPLTEMWPDFSPPLDRPNEYYYVDKGQYLTKDAGIAAGVVAGTGSVDKTVYGLQHDDVAQEPIKIYARLPGDYE